MPCTFIFFGFCSFEIYSRGTLCIAFYGWTPLLFGISFYTMWLVFGFKLRGDGRLWMYFPGVKLFRLDATFKFTTFAFFKWFSFYLGCSNFSFSRSYNNSFKIVYNCSFSTLTFCRLNLSTLFSSFRDWLPYSNSSFPFRSSTIVEFKLSMIPSLSLTYV